MRARRGAGSQWGLQGWLRGQDQLLDCCPMGLMEMRAGGAGSHATAYHLQEQQSGCGRCKHWLWSHFTLTTVTAAKKGAMHTAYSFSTYSVLSSSLDAGTWSIKMTSSRELGECVFSFPASKKTQRSTAGEGQTGSWAQSLHPPHLLSFSIDSLTWWITLSSSFPKKDAEQGMFWEISCLKYFYFTLMFTS